jgi:predicted phage terminase large subunit-like protein
MPNNVNLTRLVRYWDLASTDEEKAKKATGADPDYTASCLLGLGDNGNLYVLEVSQDRKTPANVETLVKTTANADKQKYGMSVATWIEQEPGSSGANTVSYYARHVLLGHNFRGDKPTGNKIERARAASAASENRLVYIIKGAKTKLFLSELQGFPLAAHDDMVDAFSAALIKIAESATIGKQRKPRSGKRKRIWD